MTRIQQTAAYARRTAVGPPEPPTGDRITAHAWRTLAVTAAAVFVVFLDATVVNIAFPAISANFRHATRADLSWVLNAYAVVIGALLVTTGQLADRSGRKRVFLAGLIAFAAASALCGLAPSVGLLVAARAVQAVGAAMLVPSSLALLLTEFPLARRAEAVGIWGAAGAVAAATGPTLGALLIDGPGWRGVFFTNVPFCLIAYAFGRRVLRESTAPQVGGRVDAIGVLLVTVVFGALSLGVVQGQQWGWTSARIVGSFAVAAVLVPALIIRALNHPSPALPVRLFRVRLFTLATVGTLLFGAAFFANILCNVLFLTGVWHWSLLHTAAGVLPAPVLAALTAPLAGRLAERVGFAAVIVPGALSMVASQVWFATRTHAHPAYFTQFLPGNVLAGLAIGFAMATLGAASAQALPPQLFAIGSAVAAAARQLGAVIGVAILVAVLGQPTPAHAVTMFHRSWAVIAVIASLATLASLGLGRGVARRSA